MSGETITNTEFGAVEDFRGCFRVHVQCRGRDGRKAHLRGPCRPEASQADGDLKAMRAAAAVFPDDRVKAFQSMHSEARRLQTSAQYAREIEAATLRRIESDYQEAEEECLETDDDADECWRDPQDGKTCTEVVVEEKPRQISTPVEATEALLKTYRPIRESVDELRRLLDLRADPSVDVPPGFVSPLRHVILFAPVSNVVAMRDLLLQHGAVESDDDKQRWFIRRAADDAEPARLREFYGDDRHLSPWGAAMHESCRT